MAWSPTALQCPAPLSRPFSWPPARGKRWLPCGLRPPHLGPSGAQTQALLSSSGGDRALQTIKCPVSLSPSRAQPEQLHKQPQLYLHQNWLQRAISTSLIINEAPIYTLPRTDPRLGLACASVRGNSGRGGEEEPEALPHSPGLGDAGPPVSGHVNEWAPTCAGPGGCRGHSRTEGPTRLPGNPGDSWGGARCAAGGVCPCPGFTGCQAEERGLLLLLGRRGRAAPLPSTRRGRATLHASHGRPSVRTGPECGPGPAHHDPAAPWQPLLSIRLACCFRAPFQAPSTGRLAVRQGQSRRAPRRRRRPADGPPFPSCRPGLCHAGPPLAPHLFHLRLSSGYPEAFQPGPAQLPSHRLSCVGCQSAPTSGENLAGSGGAGVQWPFRKRGEPAGGQGQAEKMASEGSVLPTMLLSQRLGAARVASETPE